MSEVCVDLANPPSASVPTVRFGVLGSLSVEVGGRPVPLGPLKQQLVLALQLCRANTVVSVDLLTDVLWGDEPPRTARKNLQVYMAGLRRLLGDAGTGDRLVHRNGGYLLRAQPGELDLLRFEQLADAGRRVAATEGPAAAAVLFEQALALWRGPLLDGLPSVPVVHGEAERLNRRYLAAFEDWIDAALATGRASSVVDQVCEEAGRNPFRERLRQLQMTALHRSGRQGEALAVYDDVRQLLARELGLRPSPALEKTYRTLLTGNPVPAGRAVSTGHGPPVVLPPLLGDFTGRAAELRQLTDRLGTGRARAVAVTGPVGAGKTSLAVEAAHRLAGRFPDGRIFVRLRSDSGAPRPIAAVYAELLRSARVPAPADPDELAVTWQSWLLGRQVLLVLDDAVDQAGVRALMPPTGDGALLVTGRPRLAGPEFAGRIELDPFSVDEARELLQRIIGADRVASDPVSAVRIVEGVGLSPLAVRAAANKLGVLRHLPLAEFADRFLDCDALLNELTAGDAGLRSRVATWLSDLTEQESGALRRLSWLTSPRFTFDQADDLLAGGAVRCRQLLESLIEAGAVIAPPAEVTAHAAVYELPRLIRCYARELQPTV